MKLRTKSKYGDESKGGVKEMNNNSKILIDKEQLYETFLLFQRR